MAKVRQEINLCSRYTGNQAEARLCRGWLDSGDLGGTVTYYFEAWIAKGTGTDQPVYLKNSNGDTEATLTASSYSYVRHRTSFTPDNSYKEKYLDVNNSYTYVGAARIVMVQDIGGNTTLSTVCQFEVGALQEDLSSAGPLTYPKYWKYESAKFDGTPTFTACASWKNDASNTQSVTIKLQEDDGSFANWTDKATIVSSGQSSGVPTYTESAAFTPTDGRHYRIYVSGGSVCWIGNAGVIATLSGASQFQSQMLVCPYEATSSGAVGMAYYDPAEFDGVGLDALAEHAASSSSSNTKLQKDPDGTPTDLTNSNITGANLVRGASAIGNLPNPADEIAGYVITA